jgi:GNAT superfamily N-acetyltransferase
MKITVRQAVREDCARLMELVRELAEFEHALHEVSILPEDFAESGFGENPVWWAQVAECDGCVCGFALYYIRFSTWKGQRMYLEDLYITKEMRGKGVGTLLLECLIDEARRKGFTGIGWQALEWNKPALAFYEKYGAKFDAEWVNCSIEL